jgi:hypothetical protein
MRAVAQEDRTSRASIGMQRRINAATLLLTHLASIDQIQENNADRHNESDSMRTKLAFLSNVSR